MCVTQSRGELQSHFFFFFNFKMTNQPESASGESQFKPFHIMANSIGRYWDKNGKVKLIITAVGIFVSYFIVGILQEKIMRGCYRNETGNCDKFKYELTLVGVQFIFSFTFIKGKFKIYF